MPKNLLVLAVLSTILGVSIFLTQTKTVLKSHAVSDNKILQIISDDFNSNTSNTDFYQISSTGPRKIPAPEKFSQPELSEEITGTKKIAVILINFKNDTSQPWTKKQIKSWTFTDKASIASYFKETSFGKINLTGSVYGYYTLPNKNNPCNELIWMQEANKLGAQDEFNPENFDHIMYAFPKTSACTYTGAASFGGKYSWINGSFTNGNPSKLTDHNIPIHELGHNFGAMHASSRVCTTESGAPTTLSTNCTHNEYGDIFDVMGGFNNTRQMSAIHKRDTRWLPKKDITTVSTSGTYKLGPVELLGGHPEGLKISRGNNTNFYIDFRKRDQSFDNFQTTSPAVNGVTIRLESPNDLVELLDMHPETSLVNDAPLLKGEKFIDHQTGVQIETLEVKPNVAEVKITF